MGSRSTRSSSENTLVANDGDIGVRLVGSAGVRRTKSASVVALCLLLAAPASTVQAARTFSDCGAVVENWFMMPARDDRARTAYIDWMVRNYYEPVPVKVMPAVYRRHIQLDRDRDGVLCEEDYYEAARARKVAAAIGRAFCLLSKPASEC